jgi:hypothetical protein
MAKEWILNSAMNRFQLNFKRNVGPTSESIRKCEPKNLEEWRDYYFKEVRPKDHIIELGKKLYRYWTEIKTIYGQLEQELGNIVEPAPDKWDRLYNVDFFIRIKENHIGLQIKPVNQGIQLSQIFKEKGLQEKTHAKFEKEFGGKVFYIFSSKPKGKKVIMNPEVIEEIRKEINRLEQ